LITRSGLERALVYSGGLAAAVALLALMTLTFVDVVGRKLLSHSVPGGLEFSEMLMVLVVFGGLPLVSARAEHVVFDSFDRWVPPALRDVQARLVHAVCAGVFGLLAWLLVQRGLRFAEYGETTVHWQLPIAPVAWVMAALLALTAIVHALLTVWPQAANSESASAGSGP
jgi:TRAP-type transport system small permease protein